MQGQIALILRTFVLYPLAGGLAGVLGFLSWNEELGVLVVDVNAASVLIAATVWASVSGGTFFWSRLIKKVGGLT